MIHLWYITENDDLVLDVKQLLKYPLLAEFYKSDKSKEKIISNEYFKYIDFMTDSAGYCSRVGLNSKESHEYSFAQTRLPKDFIFPKNNDEIILFVKDNIEYDVIGALVRTAVKAMRISTKSLEAYMDTLNELSDSQFRDKDGNYINISDTISKCLTTISNIPKDTDKLEQLLIRQKNNKQIVRGTTEYKSSMDSDADIERYSQNDDEDEDNG